MSGPRSLFIRGGVLVTMDGRRQGLAGDLLIAGDRIAAVGSGISAPPDADVLDARDGFVLPGFVQAHVHVVQSLARGHAEGFPLLRWLTERIWPYEAALEAQEVSAAARLGVAELLAGGTTAALDMGTTHDQDEVFAAAQNLGIRFASGKCHMDVGDDIPKRLREDTDESLAEAERLGARWHGEANGRLRYAVAPRFALSCSPDLMTRAAALARRHSYLLHSHASENADETRVVRECTGRGSVAFLADLGLAGRDTVLAHCVHLDEAEVIALATQGTAAAHCPGANLKLASGIADLPRLLAAGVRLGLGADGPPCNNRLSIFHEMALAGTLHNLAYGDGAVDPWTVLELATCRGAAAIGLEQVGRLTPGWKADVVVLDRRAWAMSGDADLAATIVYGGGVESVRHVVVDGRIVVHDRELTTADAGDIRRQARRAEHALASRLGW